MCGIAGVLSPHLPPGDTLRGMNQALFHRGPDDGGDWSDPQAGVALMHRRLAIIDLSPAGRQPMASHCGRYVLVFNGEIYNHLELRETLTGEGWGEAWRGHSDTETLLACFACWGVKQTLVRTVGMFALALWDRSERRLHLARDRFGEKPLYYGWSRGAFLFGSELAALRKYPGFDNPVDRQVVSLYLQYSCVPAPYGIYQNTFKLEPGCWLSVELPDSVSAPGGPPFAPFRERTFAIERYWSFEAVIHSGRASLMVDERDAIDQLEHALMRSVRQQSVADVALGAFLSGGIDSSTIAALMQRQSTRPIKTFTIGFADAAYDEAPHAKAVAQYLGTDHTELYVTAEETLGVIPGLPQLYSEPFADASQIPTFLVAKMARRQVTVALSGDAGDEVFGGYTRYLWAKKIWSRVGWLPFPARRAMGHLIQRLPASFLNSLGRRLPGFRSVRQLGDKAHKLAHRLDRVDSIEALYSSLVTQWPAADKIVVGASPLRLLLDQAISPDLRLEPEHQMMAWDTLSYLPDDILQKVDRAAMGVSLETRVPFLDHRVVELAWRMPLSYKIRNGEGKSILRRVLHRHVPAGLVERPKAGFGIPVGDWLRGPLREWAEPLLDEARLRQEGWLDVTMVRTVWGQHARGTCDWTARIWTVLMFQAWLDQQKQSC